MKTKLKIVVYERALFYYTLNIKNICIKNVIVTKKKTVAKKYFANIN